MNRTSLFSLLLAVAVLFVVVPASNADQINPGGFNVTVNTFNTANLGNLLANTGPTAFTLTSSAGGSLNGTYQAAVYQDVNGGLDFLYQVNGLSNGTQPGDFIAQLSMASFAGFTTGLGVIDSTFGVFTSGSSTLLNPTGNDRSADGSTVDFAFQGSNQILAGQSSGILVISTNATAFQPGTLNILDNGEAQPTPSGFEPTVPEPTSMALLGIGLLGIAGVRRFWL